MAGAGTPKLTREEEEKFIEKVKTGVVKVAPAKKKISTREPDVFLTPEFRKAAWVTHCFYVIFLGFFCLQHPTDRNIKSFFAWVALGFFVWLRYSVFG